MATGGKRAGAGERVLEGRHVIGLFMLMMLFSGVFFTLGYVMGRNQYDGQVRAATDLRGKPQPPISPKPNVVPKRTNKSAPVLVRTPAPPKTSSGSSKSLNAPLIPGGAYTLQVAALTREADALELATRLQKRKFPAFVVSPQTDKYYRVQVGPYADQKAAEAARKGLEGAGFKAIVKH